MRSLRVLALLASGACVADAPRVEIVDGGFEVALAPAAIAGARTLGEPEALLSARVDRGRTGTTPLLGSVRIGGDRIRFEPRFPLTPGLAYEAAFDGRRLPLAAGAASRVRVTGSFRLPAERIEPSVLVTAVFPSGEVLPENLLRFYLHFSAPVTQGRSYEHVRLLDHRERPVALPFLEIGEELWDPDGTRLTLLFDPARIKRGLLPREVDGPALVAGRTYTLEVASSWPDARGAPLLRSFRKTFRVAAADTQQPRLVSWRLQAPRRGTTEALVVRFAEPLDHALLDRMLWVTGGRGREITGTVAIERGETRWRFTPDGPWRPGRYRLVVDTALEDRAGNSIRAPFDVDVFERGTARVTAGTQHIEFRIE